MDKVVLRCYNCSVSVGTNPEYLHPKSKKPACGLCYIYYQRKQRNRPVNAKKKYQCSNDTCFTVMNEGTTFIHPKTKKIVCRYCHEKFIKQEKKRKEAEDAENRSKLPVPFIEPPKEPAPSSACVKAMSEIFPALKSTDIVDPVPRDVYLEGLKIAMAMKPQEPVGIVSVGKESPNPGTGSLRLCCEPTCKEPLVTLGYIHPFIVGERCCRKCYMRYRSRKQRNAPYGPFKPCANPSCERLTEKKVLCRFCFREQYKVFGNAFALPSVPPSDPSSDSVTGTEQSLYLDEPFLRLPGSSKPDVLETSGSERVPIASMIHPLLDAASEVCTAPIPLPATTLPFPEVSQRNLFAAPEPFTVSSPIAFPGMNQTFQLIGETYSFLTRPDTAFLESSAVTQEARKDFPAANDPSFYSSMLNTRGLSTPGLAAPPVPLDSSRPAPPPPVSVGKEPPNLDKPISEKDHFSCSRRVTQNTDRSPSTALRLCCDPTCKEPLVNLGFKHPYMTGERCCSKCYQRYRLPKQNNVPSGRPFKPCANPSCERLTEKKGMCQFCFEIEWNTTKKCAMRDCNRLLEKHTVRRHPDDGKPVCLACQKKVQMQDKVPIPLQEPPNASKPISSTFRLCCDPSCKQPLVTRGRSHPFMIGEKCCLKCYNYYFLRKQRNIPYGPFKPCANQSCERLTDKTSMCRFCFREQYRVSKNSSTLPATTCSVPFSNPPSDSATRTEPSPHLDEPFPKSPGSSKAVVLENSGSELVPIASMIHPLLDASEVCIAPIPLPATILPIPKPSQRNLFDAPEPCTVSSPIAPPIMNQAIQFIGDTHNFQTKPDTEEAREDSPAARVIDPSFYSTMFNRSGLSTPGLIATPVSLLSPPTPSTAPQPVSIAVANEHLCGGKFNVHPVTKEKVCRACYAYHKINGRDRKSPMETKRTLYSREVAENSRIISSVTDETVTGVKVDQIRSLYLLTMIQ